MVLTSSYQRREPTHTLRAGLYGALLLLAGCQTVSNVRVLIFASDYEHAADKTLHLDNTLVDARLVDTLFRRIGAADVHLVVNPTADVWQRELMGFAQRLRPTDTAVLYYAGHAVQVNGQNYFLATDGTALISADQMLSVVMPQSRAAVFFVDACRNNPFREGLAQQDLQVQDLSHGDSRGLRRKPTPEVNATLSAAALSASIGGLSQMGNLRGANAIVFFSTEPGNVAVDGAAGQGSPFANAVVTELRKQQPLDLALRRITGEVSHATRGRQSPWRQGDLGFPLFLAGEPKYDVPPAF